MPRGKFYEGQLYGGNFPEGKHSRIIVWEAKVWGIIILGEFHRAQLFEGSCSGGDYPGVTVLGKKCGR